MTTMHDIKSLLDEYQEQTHTTAIYPEDPKIAVSYLLLGLLSEIKEFVDAGTKDDAIPELGDVMWFASELATLNGVQLSDIVFLDPLFKPPSGDIYAAGEMVSDLTDVAGFVAKYLRDNSSYQVEMNMFLCHVVITVDSICDIMNVSFTQLLEDNLAKLRSRKARGKLSGSGDKR